MKIDFKRILALIMTVVMVVTTITFTAGNTLKAEGEPASEPAASEPAKPAPAPEPKSEPAAEPETPSGDESANGSGDGATNGETATEGEAVDEEEAIEEEEEEKYPAQSFSKTAGNGMTVRVSAPEGAFPEGTSMSVSAVGHARAVSLVEGAAGEVEDANGVDINFHKDGKEVQPKKNINVSLGNAGVEGESFDLYHITGGGASRVSSASSNGASFSASHFSIYIIAGEGTGEPEEDGVATYKFEIDGVVQDDFTQIVKKGDNLYKPEVAAKDGKVFSGWFKSDGSRFTGFGEVTESFEGSDTVITLYGTYKSGEYTVYFHAGDKICETRTGTTGTKIDTSEILVRTEKGESALGWYEDQAFTKKVDVVTIGASDMHLYAKISSGHWINYDSNGGTPVDSTFVASADKSVAPTSPTREGYTFNYWALNGNKYTFGQTLSSDIELKAVWKAGTANYTVIHWWENADDDDFSFKEAETKTGTSGASTAATAKSYDGFVVQSISQKTIAGDGSTIVNVYYKRNIYKVVFSGKGTLTCKKEEHSHGFFCLFGCDREEHEHGTSCYSGGGTITAKYGAYIGDKWPGGAYYVSKSGSTWQAYLEIMPLGGMTFYDQTSSSSTSTATYYVEALDGSWKVDHVDKPSVGTGNSVTKEDQYALKGFTFNSSESTKIGKSYNGAKFYYDRNSYDVKFVNNGSVEKTVSKKYEASLSDISYTPKAPSSKSNYKFAGWYDNEYCEGNPINLKSKTMPANNITLYAKWEAPKVTVTAYNKLNGGTATNIVLEYGNIIPKSKLPSSPDGEILGWVTKTGNGYKLFNIGSRIYSDTTIYPYVAKTGGPFTITYDKNGATGTAPTDNGKYMIDTNATIAGKGNMVAPEGKHFAGWGTSTYSKGDNIYQPGEQLAMTKNYTLYAQWDTNAVTDLTLHLDYQYPEGDNKTQDINTANNGKVALPGAGKTIAGWTFAGWYTQKNGKGTHFTGSVRVDNKLIENNTLYGYWVAKNVGYKVQHKLQQTDGTYKTTKTENKTGLTGQMTAAAVDTAIEATGYKALSFENVKIKGDGSTVVVIKYNRNEFSLTVHYKYKNNNEKAADDATSKVVKGNNYNVVSPTIEDFTPDIAAVTGTMGNENIEKTVYYSPSQPLTINVGTAEYSGTYDGKTHGGAVTPSVPAAKGTTVKYSTDNGVTWSADYPTIKDQGTINVKVKATNARYGNAEATYQLKVERRAVVVKGDALTKTYNTQDPELTAQVSNVVAGETDKISYAVGRDAGEDVGTYATRPTGNATQGNYTVTYENGSLEITKAGAFTVSATGFNGPFDNQTHAGTVSASVTEGTTFEYSTDGGTTYVKDAPTVKNVTANPVNVKVKAINKNYETAYAEYSLNVTPAAVTVTAVANKKMYGTQDPELVAKVTGVLEDGVKLSYTVSRAAGEDVGKYTITPKGAATQGNYKITYKTAKFTITQSTELTIDVSGCQYNKPYDADTHGEAAVPSDTATVTYSTDNGTTWSQAVPKVKDVADSTAVMVKAENPNYVTAEASYELTVTHAPVKVKATNSGKTYGAKDPKLPGYITGLKGGESEDLIKYDVVREAGENVGTYEITPSGDKIQGNYEVTYENGVFTISEADTLKVTGTDIEAEYDGEFHGEAAVATVTEGTKIEYSTDNGTTWTESVPKVKNVADSKTVKVRASNSNYKTATSSYTLTITRKAVSVTADNAEKTYGENDPSKFTATVSGTIGTDKVDYSVERQKSILGDEDAGTYENVLIASGTQQQGNYAVSFYPGTFTIKKADGLTLNVDGAGYEGPYDAQAHGSAASVYPSKVDGTELKYSTDGGTTWSEAAPTRTAAGTTSVIAKAEHKNFNTVTKSYEIKITPKAVTVSAGNYSKMYKDADPEFTPTESGLLNGDKLNYSVHRETGESVGNYEIYFEGATTQGNYAVTFVKGNLEITDNNTLRVTPNDGTWEYDNQAHSTTAQANIATAKVEYKVGNNNWSTVAPSIINPGTMTVDVRATCDGYATATDQYTLTVTRKTVTVKANDINITYGDTVPELTATVTGELTGQPVTYSLSREDGIAAGTYTITPAGNAEQYGYTVNYIEGTLNIKAKEITNEADFELTGLGDEMYDGAAHKKAPTLKDTKLGKNLQNGTDYTLSYKTDFEQDNFTDVGTIVVTITGKGNYSGTVEKTYKITKRPVTLTSASQSRKYNGSPLTNSNVTIGGKGFAGEEGATFNVTGTITEVGTAANEFTYELKQGTKAGNYNITTSVGELEITVDDGQVTVTVTGNKKAEVYDGTEKSVKGYAAVSNVDRYNVSKNVNFNGTDEVKGTAANTYNMGLAASKFENRNANYNNVKFDVTDGKLVIVPSSINPEDHGPPSADDPKPVYDGIVLTNDPSDVPYDGDEHQWYPELQDKNGNKLTYGDDYTVSWEKTSGNFTDVGTINVTITGKGNYGGTLNKSYKITPKTVTVKANPATKLYGTADPQFTASVEGTAAANITYTVTRPGAGQAANEVVKKYTNAIVPSGDAVQGNFSVTYQKADFEITKAKIGPEDDPAYTGTKVGKISDVVYNGAAQKIKPSVTDKNGTALSEGTDYEVSFSQDCKNVGTVTVTVTGIGGYEGTVTRTYKITPADVTISMHSTSKTYGDDDPETFEYDVYGIKGSDDLNIVGVREAGEEVGTYTISANYDTENANYNVTVQPGTFTIAQANTNTVIVEGTEVAYDGDNHSLKSVTATKAGSTILYASSPDSTQWSPTKPSYKAVGTYTVYVKATNPNYAPTPIVSGTVKIKQATVKVVTNSKTRVFDGTALTADGSISGIAKGESVDFAVTGTRTEVGSSQNSYSLKWTHADATNYQLEESVGTLTVVKSSINEDDPKTPDPEDPEKPVYNGVKVGTIGDSTFDGQPHQNAPKVTDKGGNVLTLGTDYVIDYPKDCTNAGTITATIRGINNYGGQVTRTYKINPKAVSIIAGTYTKVYKTDDPAFDKFTVSGTISDADTAALKVQCKRVDADKDKEDVGDTIGITATYTPNSNYTVSVTDGTLAIVQSGENFVTVTDYEGAYDGLGHTVKAKAEKAGSTIEYAKKADATEWSTSAPEFTTFGQYSVYVRATNKNYKTTAVVEGHVVISKARFTVTTESDTKTFDGKPLKAGGSYNGLVNGEKLAKFDTTGSQTEVGSSENTYVIDWGSTDKSNYSLVESIGTLKVTSKSINSSDITVEDIEDVPYNGTPQRQPVVVKDNGTELVEGQDYTLTYPSDCTNSGTITVTITGINNYSETKTVQYKITKLNATVTALDADKKVGQKDPSSFATETTGTLEGETVTINSVTREAGEHVGTYEITPAGPESQRNYKVKFVAGTFTINPASIDPEDGQTIISDAPTNYKYDGTDHKWIPVVTDKNEVPLRDKDYEVIYKRGDKETTDFESAGEITVIIKAKEGGDYTGQATRHYTIKKADLNVTVTNATKKFGADDPAFGGTVTGLVEKDKNNESRIKITYDRIAADKGKEKAGADITLTATVTGSATDNYKISITDAKLVIQKAGGNVVTLAADSGKGTYNGAEQKLVKASALEGSTIWYSLNGKDWSKDQPGFKDAGSYTVYVKATHEDYDDSDVVPATVVISPKAVTVVTKSDAKAYDGAPLKADGTISGIVEGEKATLKVKGSQTAVGSSDNSYEIEWGEGTKAANYAVSDTVGKLVVVPASIDPDDPKEPDPEKPDDPVYNGVVLTNSPSDVPYDGDAHQWYPELKDKNGNKLSYGDDYSVTWEKTAGNFIDIGTINVTITGKGNYGGTINKSYKITPKSVTVKAKAATKRYGTADPKFTADVEGTAAGNITFEVTRPGAGVAANETVGTHKNAIVPKGETTQGNFTVAYEKADFEITKAKIGPKDDPAYTGTKIGSIRDVVYNGAEQQIKPSVTNKDDVPLIENEDYKVSFSKDCKNVGTVTVTITGIGGYEGTVTRTYDITPASVTIAMNDASKVYGEDDPEEFTYSVTGIKGSDDLKITGIRTAGESVGKYAIGANYDKTNGNYAVTVEPGTFTITKASSNTVEVVGTEVDYDGNKHSLKSATATKPGSTILYASSAASTQWSPTVPTYKAVGTYTVFVKATNPDYETTPIVSGTIKINKATVKVVTNSKTKVYDGTPATASGSINGIAKSESVDFEVIGSRTSVGQSDNSYRLEWTDADATNYQLDEEIGKLTVVKSSINEDDPTEPDPENPEEPVYNGVKVGTIGDSLYDGQPHKNAPKVTDKDGNDLRLGTDYVIVYPDDCTSAGKITVTIKGINDYGGEVTRTYNINPKNVTITTGNYTKVYKENDPAFDKFTVTGTVSDADTAALKVKCKRVEADKDKEDVGDTIGITAEYVPNSNYKVTVSEGTLEIVQSGENFVTVTDYSGAYDSKAHTVTAKAEKAGSTIEYASKSDATGWSTTAPEFTKVGNYKVYVRATNKNYKTTEVVEGHVVISKATLVVTTESKSQEFNGKELKADGKYEGLASGDKLGKFEVTGVQQNVGSSTNTYKITWGDTDKDNYTVSENLGTLTVTAKSINNGDISVEKIADVPYNGTPQRQPVEVKDNGKKLIEGTDYILTYPDDCTNAGTIVVKITGIGNYSDSKVAQYEITKLNATVTAKNASKKVGQDDPAEFATKTTGTLQGETVVIESVTRQAGEHAGTYDIIPAGPASQQNYNVTFVNGTFTIEAVSIDPKDGATIISDAPTTYQYDGTDHKWIPTVTDKKGNALRDEDYEVIYKRGNKETTDFESAGEITVIIKAKEGGDYTGQATRSYTIKKAPLGITVTTVTKAHGEKDPEFGGTVVGLAAKDQASTSRINIEYARIAADKSKEKVGADITINATVTGSAVGNYNINITKGKLIIQKASGNVVSIDPASGKGTYNGAEQRLVKASALEGSTIWYSLDGKEWSKTQPGLKDAGTYTVYVKATHENYDDSAVVPATVVIAPKAVKIVTESAAKGYDGTPLTAKASIEGLVKGESVTLKATGSQTAIGRSENTYDITWDKAKKDNYDFTEEIGFLTVHIASVDPKDPVDPDPKDPDPYNPVYTGITPDKYGPVKYDGTEKKWTPVLKNKSGKTLVAGKDYKVEYLTDDMTNVGEVKVRITGLEPNYAGTITKSYQIVPRNVTLTSASATKVYDGTELRADTVKVTGDGFVKDEGFIYQFNEPGQTEIGSKKNVFIYKLYTGAEVEVFEDEDIALQGKITHPENYNIKTVYGTLRVTAAGGGGGTGGNDDPGVILMVNDTPTQIADENAPAALKLFGEDCCILHLLIMLAALLLMIWYVRDSKARQRRILELEEELGINSPLE